jgi:hypothetical protein
VRHLKIIGLCLAAAFAVAAVMASSAFAGSKPEWGQCFAKAGGKYTDAACQNKGKGGAFEWRKSTAVVKKGFTGSGGSGLLSTQTIACEKTCVNEKGEETAEAKEHPLHINIAVECTGESAAGEDSGKNGVKNVSVTFTGCLIFGSAPCNNTANPGEIKTSILKGELGYINKAAHEVGIVLEPETKKGLFAKFECGENFITTEVGQVGKKQGPPAYAPKGGGDKIISPITPVNVMTTSLTQVYTVNEGDENIPSKFEGGKLSILEAVAVNTEKPADRGLWSPAGEAITNVNTTEEAVEIKG